MSKFKRRRIKEALRELRPGMLVIPVRDSFNLLTPASPQLGSICRIIKIDPSQRDLQVLIQQIDNPRKTDWWVAVDLEPCPSHWQEKDFATS